MALAEAAATGVPGVWFLLTAVIQLPSKRIKAMRLYEPTGHLLPGWNFFAPKPIVADMELLYRHVPADRACTEPTEWAPAAPAQANTVATLLFNPGRRTRKVVFHCCHRLLDAQARPEVRENDLTLSVPYILLLDRVSALCPGSQAVQFRIDLVRHLEAAESRTAYQSLMHAVENYGW
jgi:hypothetical protein